MPVSIVEPTPRTQAPVNVDALLQVTLDLPRGTAAVAGELDLATVHAVREAVAVLARGPGRVVTIDLAELRFIDACGIGEMVRIAAWLRSSGRQLTLTRPSARIRRTFALAGLEALL